MHSNVRELVGHLKDMGVKGTIKGDKVMIGNEERRATLSVADWADRHWTANDQRIDAIDGADWVYWVAADARAWVERGEITYRDMPIRRRR
jgi:hypothetical protein